MINDILFYLGQYLDRYTFLVPLGIIGIWRWSVWMMKEIVGLAYRPKTKAYNAKVSIITPVYNENPKLFEKVLLSWKENRPAEIIAVIDYTDEECIKVFKKFQKNFSAGVLIITKIPGKRQALADGIKAAKSEILALVDSDTIWVKDTLQNGLPPFHDKLVAGVATYQSVLAPKTFAQKVFDIQLDLRYRHEYPFLAALGNALPCLSGRTAFYRKDVILPMTQALVDETFLGKPVISGDDKRLTYLVLAAGFKVSYQSTSHVYTPGMTSLQAYLKQRLRWTRNSLRADISAMRNGWPLKHPALLFFQIDKFLQSFVVLFSPIFFFVALYFHFFVSALIIGCWWLVSRTIKMYPNLFRYPKNFFIMPGYVLYTFFSGVLRIYAFFTLNTQGWITRWDKSRLPQLKFINAIPAYAATVFVIMLLTYGVYLYKEYTYVVPREARKQFLLNVLPRVKYIPQTLRSVLGVSTTKDMNLLTKRYKTGQGETFTDIARKFGVDENQLLYANSAKTPNKVIPEGVILTIPGKGMALKPEERFLRPAKTNLSLSVEYDEKTNTLLVRGRGEKVTLKDIRDNGGKDYLKEVSPKVWYAKATIFIYYGATLELDKREVEWLRLESNEERFVMLRSLSGDIIINGVKITSWDENLNDYDKDISNGRSFIMAKDNARMDIYNSELSYLGYATRSDLAVSPYGVSWKLAKDKLKTVILTGEVMNNRFHHNYFGAYTYGATGMIWRGNQFYDNISYGLDPHDDSSGFLVEKNTAYNNGTHGIIFSKRCMYNIIRDNHSYNNKLHGIMLHEKSDSNLVENNLLTGNASGVALYASNNNIVRNNTIKDNRHGIRANANSNNNSLENNNITGSRLYGLYFYDGANNNLVSNNIFESNHVGIYIKSNENRVSKNLLAGNGIGIHLQDRAGRNLLDDNQIKQSAVYGIYTKVALGIQNILGDNTLFRNRKDIMGVNNDLEVDN